MFKLRDRKGTDFLLAPTHEEEVTTLISKEVSSYRQLPIRVYQVGRKFRDELRARSGLLRGKEFLMKDLYTFDVSEEEAMKTYDEVVLAYRRIMKRLGVPYAVVRIANSEMAQLELYGDPCETLELKDDLWILNIRQRLTPETLEAHTRTSFIFFQEVRKTMCFSGGPCWTWTESWSRYRAVLTWYDMFLCHE